MNGNRGKALEKTTDFSHLEDDSDSSLFTEKVLNPQHNSENTLHVKNYTARDLNYESKWLYFYDERASTDRKTHVKCSFP